MSSARWRAGWAGRGFRTARGPPGMCCHEVALPCSLQDCYVVLMAVSCVIQVPIDDERDLRRLLKGIKTEGHIVRSRPFDGEAVVQAVIALSIAVYPYFRT